MTARPMLSLAKPTRAEKVTRTRLDTIEITPALVKTWKRPPFQRPVKENEKVRAAAEQIKKDGVLPGIITLGVLKHETYILDGQHRLHAFMLAGIAVAYVYVRLHEFENLGQMGEEYVELNSQLVRMRPDDVLRGLEASTPTIALIRSQCSFVGYDMIRRGTRSPMLSMSTALRAWVGSQHEVPTSSGGGSALHLAQTLLMEDAVALVEFLKMAENAWGRDTEYARLWGGLNLTLVMWLYRRLVLMPIPATKRQTRITKSNFQKAMMSLSAAPDYVDWLLGRSLRDSDRSPAYTRIRGLMIRRLEQEMTTKIMFPSPPWYSRASR